MGSAPLEQSIMVMAMTAADDCTQNVSTPPSKRKRSVVQNDCGSKELKKASTDALWPKSISVPVMRRVVSPSNNRPRPKRKSPT